ncbi:MAG: hypothetical protein J5I65_03715 [Aridibacter famidurans]|nr:hypothetical protein [Aridibacter famidurans]
MFTLTNDQRKYFGLPPIPTGWRKEVLPGGPYRKKSTIYFDKETIRRQIVSDETEY